MLQGGCSTESEPLQSGTQARSIIGLRVTSECQRVEALRHIWGCLVLVIPVSPQKLFTGCSLVTKLIYTLSNICTNAEGSCAPESWYRPLMVKCGTPLILLLACAISCSTCAATIHSSHPATQNFLEEQKVSFT